MLSFEQARSIPIADVMAYLARQYPAGDKRAVLHHTGRKEDWYYSPFRQENTPSFKVDKKKNRWTDFGSAAKGFSTTIDLIIDFRQGKRDDKQDQRGALELLATIDPNPEIKTFTNEPREYNDRFKIMKRGPLKKCKKLVAVMRDRGIHIDLAGDFLDHAVIKDMETGKSQDCFACDNIKEGTDVFHPTWKNCIGPKAPSVYPQPDGSAHMVLHGNKQIGQAIAELPKYRSAVIFEGITDYLTYLTMGEGAIEPETVYSYLDNDAAGQEAQLKLGDALEAMGWELRPQNHMYTGWKDLNDWWKDNPQERLNYSSEYAHKRPGSGSVYKPKL